MFAVLFFSAALAALSPVHQDWASGPVQWIMTADERSQWKRISSDEEAEKFIQLFWARRDPTPGTRVNEFKRDFEERVRFADEHFADQDSTGALITPGAMSDRGRVLLVLGFPPNANWGFRQHAEAMYRSTGLGGTQAAPLHGARDIWLWEKEEAKQKFNLPRVEVVFVEDAKNVYRRDPQRHDFLNAMPVALNRMIVSPDLKEVPEWATAEARKAEPGAHGLLLLKEPRLVKADADDPFAGITSVAAFTKQEEVGYALEYCGEKDTVKVSVAIRGTSEGKRVSIGGLPVKARLDPVVKTPGCGLVRASVSLADLPLSAGTYTFAVAVDDGAQRYNLDQQFRIE